MMSLEVMHLKANLACSSKFSGAIASDPQPSMLRCIASFFATKGGKLFLPLECIKLHNRNTRIGLDGNPQQHQKKQESKAAKLQHNGRAIPLPVISVLRHAIVIKYVK